MTESCFPLVLHTVLWENFYNFLEDFLVFRRQVYCTLVYSRGGGGRVRDFLILEIGLGGYIIENPLLCGDSKKFLIFCLLGS